MAGGGGGAKEISLDYTPTWVIALICAIIIVISLAFERTLHFFGKKLKKKDLKALFEALLKIKDELMLVGLISLLLVVFEERLVKICVSTNTMNHMLPCEKEENGNGTKSGQHYLVGSNMRRLLAAGGSGAEHCAAEGKVQLLTATAIHDLHIFIFVLAATHIVLSAITLLLAMLKIRQWKPWEDVSRREASQKPNDEDSIINVKDLPFIQERFKGIGKDSGILSLLHSFSKQFYGSVTKSDYETMRFGFIMTHCPGNPTFNFYNCVIRGVEGDFKKVVGISWYLWIYVLMFLLLNVHGWYLYFWIAFVPLILLLIVGAKLEHIITQLAHDIAERHAVIQGQIVVKPSDEFFWFHRPRLLLYLMHFILFQNAFELAYFLFIWVKYGFHSCVMGKSSFVAPRLIAVFFVQFLFSYSTLPIYAIVTQMGSSFKNTIFHEKVHEALQGWIKTPAKARARREDDRATLLHEMSPQHEIVVEPQRPFR